MIVNFRTREISRGARKLARTPTLIIIIIKSLTTGQSCWLLFTHNCKFYLVSKIYNCSNWASNFYFILIIIFYFYNKIYLYWILWNIIWSNHILVTKIYSRYKTISTIFSRHDHLFLNLNELVSIWHLYEHKFSINHNFLYVIFILFLHERIKKFL
jgi:hypothetical protein